MLKRSQLWTERNKPDLVPISKSLYNKALWIGKRFLQCSAHARFWGCVVFFCPQIKVLPLPLTRVDGHSGKSQSQLSSRRWFWQINGGGNLFFFFLLIPEAAESLWVFRQGLFLIHTHLLDKVEALLFFKSAFCEKWSTNTSPKRALWWLYML